METTHEFLSRDEILDYRTITTLLALTDVAESTAEAQRSGYREPKNPPGTWERLNHFVNLLVRDVEVVAILTRGGRGSLSDEVTIIKETNQDDQDETLLVTKNPRGDEAPKRNSSEGFPAVNVKFLSSSASIVTEKESVIVSYLRKQSINFEDHCNVVLKLLQEHQANPNELTTKSFCFWIFLTTCKKLKGRFKAGQYKRNLWRLLAELTDQAMQESNSDYQGKLPESLSASLPTSGQLEIIRKLISQGFLEPEAEGQPLFDKAGRSRFRRALAALLSHTFQTVVDLDKLLSSQEIQQITARTGAEIAEAERKVYRTTTAAFRSLNLLCSLRKECSPQIQETLKWISTVLKVRRTTLRDACVFAKTGDKNPSSSMTASSSKGDSSSVKFNSSSPVKHTKAGPLEEVEEEAEQEEEGAQDQLPQLSETLHIDLASGDTGLSRELEAHRRLRALSLDDKQEVNDDNLDMESLAMDPKKGWAHAAGRFIQLLCTPIEAINALLLAGSEGGDAAYRSYIKRASLKVVGVKPAFRDQAMQPFSKILNDIEPDEDRRQTIEKWVRALDMCLKGENWESPKFTGTWHCEAILLSIHALSLPVDPSANSPPSITSLRNSLKGIANVPDDVLEALTDRGEILTVSKRCCPACNKLAKLMLKEGRSGPTSRRPGLDYPDYHVTWSAVTLPPWLPRRFALKLLIHAETILFQRFNRIINLIDEQRNVRKRSASVASTGLECEGEPSYKKRKTAKDTDSLLTLKEQREENEKTMRKVKMTIDNIGDSEIDED